MKITEIKAQVKTPGRFSIFVDGKYAFSLSDMTLIEEGLRVGQDLDTAAVGRLKQVSNDDKVYGQTLRYVAIRPHSEWEVRSYLQRKAASPTLVDHILGKLAKLGVVDDARFARAWVETRRLLRPTSRRKLQQELRAKHVSDVVIRQVLAEDGIDERVLLRELVAKKRARYPDKLKLMQYLARQGFGYEDIKTIVDEG